MPPRTASSATTTFSHLGGVLRQSTLELPARDADNRGRAMTNTDSHDSCFAYGPDGGI